MASELYSFASLQSTLAGSTSMRNQNDTPKTI